MGEYKVEDPKSAASILRGNGFKLKVWPYGYSITPTVLPDNYPTRWFEPLRIAELWMTKSELLFCNSDEPLIAEYQDKIIEILGLKPAADDV